MVEEKKSLQNDEMGKVAGSGYYYDLKYDDGKYDPYTNTDIPVTCPKCGSRNIWYDRGMFGIEELDEYWCRNCAWRFDYGELDHHGSNGGW